MITYHPCYKLMGAYDVDTRRCSSSSENYDLPAMSSTTTLHSNMQNRGRYLQCKARLVILLLIFAFLMASCDFVACFVIPSKHQHQFQHQYQPWTRSPFKEPSPFEGHYFRRLSFTTDDVQTPMFLSSNSPRNHDTNPKGNRRNNNNNNNLNNNKRYNKRNDQQLIRVIDSIIYFGQGHDQSSRDDDAPSMELIEALRALKSARSSSRIQRAGKLLTDELIDQASWPVQERILKVLSLAGLIYPATSLLNRMLDHQYLPSYISYTAVLSVLRRAGKIDQLRDLLHKLSEASQSWRKSIHIMALNLYLASLCDEPTQERLERASELVLSPEMTDQHFGISVDLTSYNTVLHGAARMGNETLVEDVWEALSQCPTHRPDSRSYNARLLATTQYPKRLEIWYEIQQASGVIPDQYTIDLILLPMLQEGADLPQRREELHYILTDFMARNSDPIVKNAFAAYMTTLVQNDQMEYAQMLFDSFIAPRIEHVDTEKSKNVKGWSRSRADTKLFNILLEGYRKQATNAQISGDTISASLTSEENTDKMNRRGQVDKFMQLGTTARTEGWELFHRMQKSDIPVDAYTMTSLMGLCESSQQVVDLLNHPLHADYTSPPVVRSAITCCGQLDEPGLACWLFDKYAVQAKALKNPRLWNVLLGALSDAAKLGNVACEDPDSGIQRALSGLQDDDDDSGGPPGSSHQMPALSKSLQGNTCSAAARDILNLMADPEIEWAPSPNGQTYCLVASALQYDAETHPEVAMSLFHNATEQGIPADGRFINAIFRCFGDDIKQALECWKSEIRRECLANGSRDRDFVPANRPQKKNLIAAYNGLLHVCGRAQRPDIGLRLAYAMSREGMEPDELTLNNYKAGKRIAMQLQRRQESSSNQQRFRSFTPKLSLPKFDMVEQYENLLYVECTKYNEDNKRMSEDQRVRIIL